MAQPVLEVKGLTKSFSSGFIPKKITILQNVNFSISAGTITGFLGPNGCGKTTTIKCILNLIFADSGEVKYFGQSKLTNEILEKIGFLPERPYFYSYLTGAEFLFFYAELSNAFKSKREINERIDQLLTRVGLEHARDRQLKDYSKGMLQRVGIAQALIHRPKLIILDEPMSGLDPDGRIEVANIIRETAKEGTAVFFSSHLLPDAEKLCERLVIIKKGIIIYEGNTKSLLEQASLGWSVSFADGTQQVRSILVESLSSLQNEIDRIRNAGHNILDVKKEHLSLEDAFRKLVV
ncbi:MAG: ABC transporter ATP-binding protein [Pseudomonadota bacterium]|nr:ABC transporter ATP-binding protein [Pseudomonadota bacterium]